MYPDKRKQVNYRPFYNQLCKVAFMEFVKMVVRFAITQWVEKQQSLPNKLSTFQNVILQDGSSFKVYLALADVFPASLGQQQLRGMPHDDVTVHSVSYDMTVTTDTTLSACLCELIEERLYFYTPLCDSNFYCLTVLGHKNPQC